jgi:hypothetical protein
MIANDDSPGDRVELLGQTLERLGRALERLLPEVIGRVVEDLEQSVAHEPDPRERQGLQSVCAMLRIESRSRALDASRALRDRAHKCLEFGRHARNEDHALALIEEEELQQQIFAGEVARAARGLSERDYDGYTGRIRALLPGLWESDELNPAGARTVAAAASVGFARLGDAGRSSVLLRESLLRYLPGYVARVIDEVDAWLRAQGIEPLHLPEASAAAGQGVDLPVQAPAATPRGTPSVSADARASAQRASGDVRVELRGESRGDASLESGAGGRRAGDRASGERSSGSRRVDVSVASTDEPVRAIEVTVQAASAASTLGRSALAAAPARAPLQILPTLQPVVEVERDAVAFAHSIDALPYSRESRAGFFGNVRERLRAAGVAPAQLSVIEVVAAMFDYVVDDRRLPEAAKPLIWRMQQPVVALALLDPAYLGDEPRSLRRLVENLGAIVNAYADDVTRGSELHRRLETVVRAVEIVAGALQTRSAVMARQVETEYGRAERNVTQLIERLVTERASLESAPGRRNRRDYRRRPGREREQEVTQRLSAILVERLDRHQVPDSVREFVLNVWLRHLRTAMLRDGENSAEFKVALEVVDDLLWTLDGTRERRSRRVLAQKIPPLIRLLAQGLRAIGARDEEFKPFFDELFLIHLRKMQRRGSVSDATEALDGTPERVTGADTGTDEGGDLDDGTDPATLGRGRSRWPSGTTTSTSTERVVAAQKDSARSTPGGVSTGAPIASSRAETAAPDVQPAASEVDFTASESKSSLSRVEPGASGVAPAAAGVEPAASGVAPAASSFQPTASARRADAAAPESSQGPGVASAPGTRGRPAPDAGGSVPASATDGTSERKLLEVLSSIDLADLPDVPKPMRAPVDGVIGSLRRGDWLQIARSDGTSAYVKVAWINARRTVVLMVRHPDRRALSMPVSELRERLSNGRAFRLG